MSSTTNGDEQTGVYQSEIMSMMYVFGDVKSCSAETALLIEEITHKQIVELVKQSYQVTQLRGAKVMSITDILFLLRKNKTKLRRLLIHLQTKHFIQKNVSKADESTQAKDSDDIESDGTEYKTKYCLDFLSDVDLQDVLNEKEIDEIKIQRQKKLDDQTKSMDLAQYTEFSGSRRASFSKNMAKFKNWLDIDNILPNSKSNSSLIEVLAYLAYDTVQEIVESALYIRDQQLLSKTPTISNVDDSSPYGTTPNFIMSAGDPAASESPISPTSSGTPTSRPRKRSLKASVSDIQATPTATPTAIQPSHVHEVMRRYTTVSRGPHIAFTSHFIKPSFTNRTLCL